MNIDLIAMIGNLSKSLYPVQHFITGGAYLLGIFFLITGIMKLKKIAGSSSYSSSHEKMFGPVAFFLAGAACLYLPTALSILSNTAFGVGSVLSYGPLIQNNFYSAIIVLIRTAGLIWFVRGCVLLTQASQPGAKTGSKGMSFLAAGILAINIENTTSMLYSMVLNFMKWVTGKPS